MACGRWEMQSLSVDNIGQNMHGDRAAVVLEMELSEGERDVVVLIVNLDKQCKQGPLSSKR